jgi:hypothetical protein
MEARRRDADREKKNGGDLSHSLLLPALPGDVIQNNAWAEFSSLELERKFRDESFENARLPVRVYFFVMALFFLYKILAPKTTLAPGFVSSPGFFCWFDTSGSESGNSSCVHCPGHNNMVNVVPFAMLLLATCLTFVKQLPCTTWYSIVLGILTISSGSNSLSSMALTCNEVQGSELGFMKFLLLTEINVCVHVFMLHLPLHWIASCCMAMVASCAVALFPFLGMGEIARGAQIITEQFERPMCLFVVLVSMVFAIRVQMSNERLQRAFFWHKSQHKVILRNKSQHKLVLTEDLQSRAGGGGGGEGQHKQVLTEHLQSRASKAEVEEAETTPEEEEEEEEAGVVVFNVDSDEEFFDLEWKEYWDEVPSITEHQLLTESNSTVYRKTRLVYAFKSSDAFSFVKKEWNNYVDEKEEGAWLIVNLPPRQKEDEESGEDGGCSFSLADMYGIEQEEFMANYEVDKLSTHQYRKREPVRAARAARRFKMHDNGKAKGKIVEVGDFVVQKVAETPSTSDTYVISSEEFMKLYLVDDHTFTAMKVTIVVPCTHTLYSYPILILYTHTLYSYTVLIHCTHTLYEGAAG